MKPETKKRWSQAACASLAWLCCFCSAALQAAAQTIATQHGGVTFDSAPEAPVVLAPPPVRATGDLVMATLPVAREPIRFYLTFGTVGRYGPYTLSHNARIGPPHATYLLGLVDQGRRFTLTAPHATNTVYGPFATTDGTSVRLGQAEMTFVRIAPVLTVALTHPDRINQLPLIGIAPDSPALERELYMLRASTPHSPTASTPKPQMFTFMACRASQDAARARSSHRPSALRNATNRTPHAARKEARYVFSKHSCSNTSASGRRP